MASSGNVEPVIDVDSDIPHEPMIDLDEKNVDNVKKGGHGKRSYMWDHFTYVEGTNKTKVQCPFCPSIIQSVSKRNGTSSMRYHLENVCVKSPHYKTKGNKKQSTLGFKPQV